MKIKAILLFLVVSLLITFCGVQKSLGDTPSYFPKPVYNFTDNPISKAQIRLGRNLFYDPILSADNTISCASCHSPYAGFTHTDHDLSHGIDDKIGTRNAPALFNLAWQNKFMWDGAITNLDAQALAPLSHETEMGSDINTVLDKLRAHPKYPDLFKTIYKDSLITGERLLKVLSQFQLTLISANAKYDKVQQGKERFSSQEKNGYALFKTNCASCHVAPLFSSYEFANNGLSIDETLSDMGRYSLTNNSEDSLKFKIPSLRNLSYTYPYMHDGRFKKLREVLAHYVSNIQPSPTLSEELKSGIQLTKNEQTDLIAFLLTLNDLEFIRNPDFQIDRDFFIGE
jgi:cytochrome c peroxidase